MEILKKVIQLKNNSGFRKYFENTSWVLAERVLRIVVTLFVGIYIARYLGPKSYGLLNYTLSFVWLFSALASFGLDEILVRELVKFPEKREIFLGTAFWLKILGTLIMGVAITIALKLIEDEQQTQWMIAIIAFGFFFRSTNIIELYFQAQVQSKYTVKAQFLQLVLTTLLKIYLVWSNAGLVWFAIALFLDQVVIAFLLLLIYWLKIRCVPFFNFKIIKAKSLLKEAWPLIFTTMVISVYMKIDQVMLKEMIDAKAVGIYVAAVKICEIWYFIPAALMTSLFPAIINSRKKSETVYNERTQKLYDLMVWGSLAIALPTTLLAEWAVLIIYGNDFQEAVGVLQIYIWAGIFVSLGIASSKWLVAENLQRYSLYRTLLGAIINIGCNLWLIPIYGIKGAAFATLIAQATVGLISLSLFSKTRKNFWTAINSFNAFGAYKRAFL